MRTAVILANAVISIALVTWGIIGMVLTVPGEGIEYRWSALAWIIGLITLWFIPFEVCVIKRRR